jgi:hypothetical protein
MRVRQKDPLIPMLQLLYSLGVTTHLNTEWFVCAATTGYLVVRDFTNLMIDVTIYE